MPGGGGLIAAIKAQEACNRGAKLTTRSYHVEHTVFEQELGGLEIRRKLLLDGLFYHTRACKADQCARLGHYYVGRGSIGGCNTACTGVNQHGDVRQMGLGQLSHNSRSFRHLHQREDAFLHTSAARR